MQIAVQHHDTSGCCGFSVGLRFSNDLVAVDLLQIFDLLQTCCKLVANKSATSQSELSLGLNAAVLIKSCSTSGPVLVGWVAVSGQVNHIRE